MEVEGTVALMRMLGGPILLGLIAVLSVTHGPTVHINLNSCKVKSKSKSNSS